MKQISTLLVALFLLSANAVFAQWTLQDIPTPDASIYAFRALGNDVLWIYTRYPASTPIPKKGEFITTNDGGATYTSGEILDDVADHDWHIEPFDNHTAYMISAKYSEPVFQFRKTIDAGATWQDMPLKPWTFPDLAYFWPDNEGIFVADPDSIGLVVMYTLDGGNTYTRIPQTNFPMLTPSEFPLVGQNRVVGNTVFMTTIDFADATFHIWRSLDRGRNWTTSESFSAGVLPFTPRYAFTSNTEAILLQDIAEITKTPLYTEDAGVTWHESGPLPGLVAWPVTNIPNTATCMAFFQDTVSGMLFSALTNDLGKTWNSRKDIAPYQLDSVFVQFGFVPIVFSNLEIVDNRHAWASIDVKNLLRYDGTEPIVPEKPDLELSIVTDNEYLDNYTSVKYTLLIRNRGITAATDVQAHWLPPYNRTPGAGGPYAFQAAYADGGNFNWWTGDWDIKNLQPGQIMTATYHLFVLKDDAKVDISAQITACDELDLDSSPNNVGAGLHEDDEVTFTATPSFASEPSEDRNVTIPTVSIFPNPAKDAFFVNYNFDKIHEVSFTVNDAMGRLIWSNTLNNAQNGIEKVDCSTLTAGVYFVKTKADGMETKVQKVVITH
jgi:Secretion system C-terminal sorting domain/Domain of unknown function DUF11